MIAVVEMPIGTTLKYEHDKLTGLLVVDRVLNQQIPFNYGYLQDTLSEDGDPLDVFILCDMAILPLACVKVEVVGIIKCLDNGFEDDKILATLVGYPDKESGYSSSMVLNYLNSYKSGFQVLSIESSEVALNAVRECQDRYLNFLDKLRCQE